MRKVTIQEVECIARRLAKEQMGWNEPIPDFGTRYSGKLESCLASIFQTYAKRDLYPTLIDKASILFYFMIKNHPFINGNKRIAVTNLLVFLVLNKKWLSATNEEIYEIAVDVAKSSPKLKRGIVELVKEFIKSNLTDLVKK